MNRARGYCQSLFFVEHHPERNGLLDDSTILAFLPSKIHEVALNVAAIYGLFPSMVRSREKVKREPHPN